MLLAPDVVGTYKKYEGVLVCHDETPRIFAGSGGNKLPLKRRQNEEAESSMAQDLLLVDKTGPVMVTLRNDAVRQFLSLVPAGQSGSPGGRLVHLDVVRVVDLPKSEWNGECLTPMRALMSVPSTIKNAGTVVTMPAVPTSSYLTTSVYTVPQAGLCTDFLRKQHLCKAPFRGSFVGMITDVQEPGTTLAGLPKLCFDLVDATGAYLRCCAIGHNAVSTTIRTNLEVVLYHVTGRGPLGNAPGMLYLFKDALIVAVSEKKPPYVKRMQVEVKGSM